MSDAPKTGPTPTPAPAPRSKGIGVARILPPGIPGAVGGVPGVGRVALMVPDPTPVPPIRGVPVFRLIYAEHVDALNHSAAPAPADWHAWVKDEGTGPVAIVSVVP